MPGLLPHNNLEFRIMRNTANDLPESLHIIVRYDILFGRGRLATASPMKNHLSRPRGQIVTLPQVVHQHNLENFGGRCAVKKTLIHLYNATLLAVFIDAQVLQHPFPTLALAEIVGRRTQCYSVVYIVAISDAADCGVSDGTVATGSVPISDLEMSIGEIPVVTHTITVRRIAETWLGKTETQTHDFPP
jgi:hypothetical protein